MMKPFELRESREAEKASPKFTADMKRTRQEVPGGLGV